MAGLTFVLPGQRMGDFVTNGVENRRLVVVLDKVARQADPASAVEAGARALESTIEAKRPLAEPILLQSPLGMASGVRGVQSKAPVNNTVTNNTVTGYLFPRGGI